MSDILNDAYPRGREDRPWQEWSVWDGAIVWEAINREAMLGTLVHLRKYSRFFGRPLTVVIDCDDVTPELRADVREALGSDGAYFRHSEHGVELSATSS